MITLVVLVSLFGAISLPLAAQDSEPTQTPDVITIPEQTDALEPAQAPGPLSPREKALIQSAYDGKLAEVQALVAKGDSVNLADKKERTTQEAAGRVDAGSQRCSGVKAGGGSTRRASSACGGMRASEVPKKPRRGFEHRCGRQGVSARIPRNEVPVTVFPASSSTSGPEDPRKVVLDKMFNGAYPSALRTF